jgi:hypothetical protein
MYVAAYLLRVTNALTLRHPPLPVRRGDPPAALHPVVLVIPRGGAVRDPYLVVLARASGMREPPPTSLTATDIHVRARIDASRDISWQGMADVLVHPGKWPRHAPIRRMALLFDRFPECEILAGRHRHGCLVGMRDGRTAVVTPSSVLRTAAATTWPAVYGSVLYTWLSAGMPIGTLEDAVVIAGHCVAGVGEIRWLVVSARSLVRVIPAPAHPRRVIRVNSGNGSRPWFQLDSSSFFLDA